MAQLTFYCDNCKAQRTVIVEHAAGEIRCSRCSRSTELYLFPAIMREETAENARRVLDEEGPCFFHPGNRAETMCAQCGRFLCPVCAIPSGKRVLCPDCMEHGAEWAGGPVQETETIRWDEIAFALAVYPLLLFYTTIVTAPVAFVFTIWAWRKPAGVLDRSRWRLPVAALAALLEMAGWAALLFFLIAEVWK